VVSSFYVGGEGRKEKKKEKKKKKGRKRGPAQFAPSQGVFFDLLTGDTSEFSDMLPADTLKNYIYNFFVLNIYISIVQSIIVTET
jgi:hypothetical protein